MKKKIKFCVYGIVLIIVTLLSVYPLSLISEISDIAFFYATISWASMFFIGITLKWWAGEMNKIIGNLEDG